MANKYFNRITISSASFPTITSPSVNIGFAGSFSLINEGTGTIEYSFDGSTVQGDLVPGTASQEMVFENTNYFVLWFRLKSGAASLLRIEGSDGQLEIGAGAIGVTGTVTANIGTTGGLALDATLTGGTASTIVRGGAKGATVAVTVTSTANGADHQGLDTIEQLKPVYEDNSAGRAIVEQRNSFANISTATTTTVKSGAGFLHLVQINAAVALATINIFDNTAGSGTLIATITMPAALLASQVTLRYDISFATGLTIVTTGAQNMTVSFR